MDQLTRNNTRISYLKGVAIFKQGAFAPYMLFVVSSLVQAYLQTGYNKQGNIRLVQAGDFLEYSSFFGENIHTDSAQALKKPEICMEEKESLKKVLLENPLFALEITTKNYRTERHLLENISKTSQFYDTH